MAAVSTTSSGMSQRGCTSGGGGASSSRAPRAARAGARRGRAFRSFSRSYMVDHLFLCWSTGNGLLVRGRGRGGQLRQDAFGEQVHVVFQGAGEQGHVDVPRACLLPLGEPLQPLSGGAPDA